MMVFRRWAIVMMVAPRNSSRIVFCTRASVFMSTAAVASSSTSTFVLRSRALARHTSCRWPTLKAIGFERVLPTQAGTAIFLPALPDVVASLGDAVLQLGGLRLRELPQIGVLQSPPNLDVGVAVE